MELLDFGTRHGGVDFFGLWDSRVRPDCQGVGTCDGGKQVAIGDQRLATSDWQRR